MHAAVDGLTDAQLAHRIDERANSIGWLAVRLVSVSTTPSSISGRPPSPAASCRTDRAGVHRSPAGHNQHMGDYERSQDVQTPAQQLFDCVAEVNGTRREGEAWCRVDRQRQHLEWGSEGDSGYRGGLDVTGDETGSTVTVLADRT